MEEKEKKVAVLLRKPDTTDQTAERTEVKPQVDIEKLGDRVSKVSKKVDNLKGSTNRKFQRITKEIDIIAEGLDGNNKKVTKLSALIEKQKKESEKDSKNAEKGDNKIITILTNMLDFMKLTFEEDKLTRDQQNNFSEEHNLEKERRDKELLEALKGRNGPTAEKIVEDDDKSGFFEKILAAMASILGPLKAFMKVLGTLFSTLSKLITSFAKFIVSAGKILLSASRLLFTPLGLGLIAFAALGYTIYKLVDYVSKNTPNYASLGPSEAAVALRDESLLKKQAATKFRTTVDRLTPEQIQQTKEQLEDTVINGRKKALDIDKMAAGPEKDTAIREIGGVDKLKAIIADEKVYTIPTALEVDTGPATVGPRPEAGKLAYINVKPGQETSALKRAQEGWDKRHGANYNPDGTKKKPVGANPVMDPQQKAEAEAIARSHDAPIIADRMDREANENRTGVDVKPVVPPGPTTKTELTAKEAQAALDSNNERDITALGGRERLQKIANPTPTPTPSPASTPTPSTPRGVSSTSPMQTPMQTPNLGTQMASMSNDNALAKAVMEINVTPNNSVNNVVATNKSNVPQTGNKIPAVRNQEETYQRMILDSTRMV